MLCLRSFLTTFLTYHSNTVSLITRIWHNDCVTLTFDLAFHWAKVRSKFRLKSKCNVISLSKSLRPIFRSEYILRLKLSRTNWFKSVKFAWKRYLKSLYFLTLAQRKSKSKVKLNFGLSPDFSVQLKRKAKSKVKVTHCWFPVQCIKERGWTHFSFWHCKTNYKTATNT